jgi:hypothetical protein
MTDVTDWDGTILSKKALRLLEPGCVVRMLSKYHPDKGIREECEFGKNCGSSSYYEIVKIKDGTLWGKVDDVYRICNCKRCDEKMPGEIMTFRFNEISEMPISWQPRSIRKKMKQYRMNKGYSITGWR